jgi:hypothetical protein
VISEPVFGKNFNTGDSYGIVLAVEDGRIYVIWGDDNNTDGAGLDRDIFYRANLTSSSWEDIQVISEPVFGQDNNIGTSEYLNIAVENGKVFVTWRDDNSTNGGGFDFDIVYRCNLTGTSWEDVQVISEPVSGQDLNIRRSSVVNIAAWENNIYAIWMDQNDTNGAGTDWDTFFRCNLSGSGWGEIEVISEPVYGQNYNTRMSGNIAISIDKRNIYAVWGDENNTNGASLDKDIFFRQKIVNPPSLSISLPKVTPKIGNTSTDFNFTMTYIQLNNTPPSVVKVIIDGMEYSMLEVDHLDTYYKDGKEYYFTLNNLDIGKHTYKFNTSDGINYTNTIIFRNLKVLNTAPQIITEDNLTAIEDVYYEVIYEYEDIDVVNVGQICQWEYSSNANWLSFDLASTKLFGTPTNDDVGQYWVDITVEDTIDIVSTNFTLTVLDVNDRPIITTNDVVSTNEDELFEVDYNASDIDSIISNQIWTLETNAKSWLNLSSSLGILNGTPGNDDVGEFWVNVTVNDTEGGFDFTNFTLTVLNVNDNPFIITDDVLLTGTDILYEVQYNATDVDSTNSQFSWILNTNATWLSIDSSTGVLSGTPSRLEAGWYIVNVSVSDGDGGSDWHEFILTVIKTNLPPKITTEDIITIMVNSTYYVDYNATDDQANYLLEWSVQTNASWLRIDSSTGVLSGVPTSNDKGKTFWVNVSVVDTKKSLDFHNFTLTVLPEPKVIVINNVPELTNYKLTPGEGDINTEFIFSITYTDDDEDPPETIKIVIDGVAFDMSLRSGSFPYFGIYEYKTKLSAGEHSYYFVTSDGSDSNTTETFTSPTISTPKKVNGDNGAEDEGLSMELLIVVIVIIIIIVLVLIFLIARKKKKEEPEAVLPEQQEYQESVSEPEQTPPTPPLYPDYQPEEPMASEDLYYTPPVEESEPMVENAYQPEEDQEFSDYEE